jgi:hypothetical protein
LEILRSILEWVKEKIDAKIGSPEDKKDRGESSQETKQERREFVPPVKGILRA